MATWTQRAVQATFNTGPHHGGHVTPDALLHWARVLNYLGQRMRRRGPVVGWHVELAPRGFVLVCPTCRADWLDPHNTEDEAEREALLMAKPVRSVVMAKRHGDSACFNCSAHLRPSGEWVYVPTKPVVTW